MIKLIHKSIKKGYKSAGSVALLVGWFSTAVIALPVKAAEEIDFVFATARLSVPVSSLQTFAETGKIDKNLRAYFNLAGATDEEKAKFQEALMKPVDVDAVQLSRFLNTAIGEDILNNLGRYISIQGGGNGRAVLKIALIKSASQPQGLTVLNFLDNLPTNIQINLDQILRLRKTVKLVIDGTRILNEEVARLSREATLLDETNFSDLPDLRQPGPYGVDEPQRILLNDTRRDREFYVDLYKPEIWRSGKTPVVIISHGLASRPADFGKRARHLASYGYFVAVPQHPGSDLRHALDLLAGRSQEVFDVQEFINRPKDISYVLDWLERLNRRGFQGRLELDRVGIYGHSFGGYTALAVAGAEIDLQNLRQECRSEFGFLNTSLLLQCRALSLPNLPTNFRDPRIQAVIAANPVNRSIFGEKGLANVEIPVLLGSGLYDPATPAIFEQASSFIWLQSPEKYLVVIEGQAHVDFSQLDAGITEAINSIEKLTLPSPELIDSYANSGIVAFFEVYISEDPDFKPYLSSAYFDYLSQRQVFNSYLIDRSGAEQLQEKLLPLKQEFINLGAAQE
ncbi:alpha/beta hydrolase [Capilliphycus salinus ALCB114379]|uniref:alpha/beta hydrolase n=1 Tax=Capilliphycus salinus TaxID=2768948 RepID=UPI0039A6AE96